MIKVNEIPIIAFQTVPLTLMFLSKTCEFNGPKLQVSQQKPYVLVYLSEPRFNLNGTQYNLELWFKRIFILKVNVTSTIAF